jgi:hypothetical protein
MCDWRAAQVFLDLGHRSPECGNRCRVLPFEPLQFLPTLAERRLGLDRLESECAKPAVGRGRDAVGSPPPLFEVSPDVGVGSTKLFVVVDASLQPFFLENGIPQLGCRKRLGRPAGQLPDAFRCGHGQSALDDDAIVERRSQRNPDGNAASLRISVS